MLRTQNFKFNTSISREGYEDKPTAHLCLTAKGARELGRTKMAFKEQEVTVSEFLDYAINGYAFCNLFRFDENKQYWVKSGKYYSKTYPVYKIGKNKGYFKLNFKSDTFFYGSQVIFVDIDFTKFKTIPDYLNTLTKQPTCVYTSYSDNTDKHGIISRRFRMVYIFDTILDKKQFEEVSKALYKEIVKDTQEPMFDLCGCTPSQYMNGSNSSECYYSDCIYSISDFELVEEVKPVKKERKQKVEFTKELINDLDNLSYRHSIYKWFDRGLRYFWKTELSFDSEYAETPDDYVALFYHREKVTDGNQRRKKLFLRAALRRIMKPDTTPDELLYNLFIDRYKFFDNSDEVLTIEVLQNKVKAAFGYSIEKLKGFLKDYKKPTFVINPTITNKRKTIGKARRNIKDKQIGELYDITLSVQENQKILNENGVKVSLPRLYEFVKENNINTKKEVKQGYNPNLSIRENMKVMGCTNYQVRKAKEEYEKSATINSNVEKVETIIENNKVAVESNKVGYLKEFKVLDEYFENNFDGAADYFRFYNSYYELDEDIKQILMNRFDLDCGVLKQYYDLYQPYKGIYNYYGKAG